jgi:hypothetical protein
MGHETEVTIYKANHKKYIMENRRGKNIDWKKNKEKNTIIINNVLWVSAK